MVAAPLAFSQQPAPAPGGPGPRINVNTASKPELMTLQGIGETEARRIVAGRPYENFPQFAKRSGLPKNSLRPLEIRIVFSDSPPVAAQDTSSPRVAKPEAGGWTPARRPPPLPYAERADINTDTPEVLVQKAHLDPMTARRIVMARPYEKLADLKKIGFPPERIRDLSHFLKVSGSPEK